MYRKYIKRLLDIFGGLVALPFVCMAIIIIGAMIYIEDKGSIFFLAKRRGLNGKVFNMYKLRSMKVNAPDVRNADNSTFNSTNDPRVTKIGKRIRKLSIDELPQVFNVLKGDMSWIGPRASIPREGYEWDDLDDEQQKRLTVRPGITGYSAALYRNSISRDEKHKLDCYYVDHMTFLLDIKIIYWTAMTVLFRKNLYTNSADSGQKQTGKKL